MKMPDWKAIDLQQKPNQREKIIFAVALVIFFGSFIKSCWIPSRRAISDTQNQLYLMEEEKGKLEKLSQLKVVLKETKGRKISLPMGEQTTLVGSLREVEEALGTLSAPQILKGVRLLKSRFSKEERQGGWVRRRVELELVGSFQGLGRYLNTLESWPAPLWIESFSMKTSGDKLSATVTGSFYGKE